MNYQFKFSGRPTAYDDRLTMPRWGRFFCMSSGQGGVRLLGSVGAIGRLDWLGCQCGNRADDYDTSYERMTSNPIFNLGCSDPIIASQWLPILWGSLSLANMG